MDSVSNILIKEREETQIEVLNCFKKDESLESLSREELEKRLDKSFSVDSFEVSRMFGKQFDRMELIRFTLFAIEE